MHSSIADGSFARAFKDRGMSVIIGEVPNEELLYSVINPPTSVADLRTQLCNYYRAEQVDKLITAFEVPADADAGALQKVFGEIVAHGQVYIPSRVLVQALLDARVPAERILRYRIAWNTAVARSTAPFPHTLTHADCQPLWWYLRRFGYTPTEVEVNYQWLAPVQSFVNGEQASAAAEWYLGPAPPDGTKLREVRDAKIAIVDDDRWERCMRLAKAIEV